MSIALGQELSERSNNERSRHDHHARTNLTGFLLLNLGYALVLSRITPNYGSDMSFVNDLVQRLGILVLSLGVVHLVNMLIFWKIRNHDKAPSTFPPAATAYMPMQAVATPGGATPPPPVNF